MKNKFSGELLLLITSIIWGLSFVSQKVGMNHMGPFSFSASRLLLGAVVLLPVIFFMDHLGLSHKAKDAKLLWQSGLICGLMIFGGISLQQVGLQYTSVGKSAFITALYILLVPILGLLFFRKQVSLKVWISVFIGTAGLYFLTMEGDFTMEKGDFLVFLSAFFWTVHILLVDRLSHRVDGVRLSAIQFLVAGMLSFLIALLFEQPNLEGLFLSWPPILFSGVIVVGMGYTLQIFGQRSTPPHVAALIMSLEAVFAVLAGFAFLQERMSLRELMGCILMFAAILLSQVKEKASGEKGS